MPGIFCLRIRSHDSSPFCTTIWEKIFVVFFTNHLTSEFKTWEFFGAVVVGWLIGWLVGWFVGWLSQHSLEPSIVRVFYMSCPILGWVLGSITLNRGLKVMLIYWGHSIANLVLQKEATSTRWSSCEPPQFCHNDSCLRIASGGRTVGWKVWNRVNVTSNLWSLLQLSLKQPTWLLLFGNIWDMFLWHHSCIFFREFCHHVILGRFQIFSFLGHFSKKNMLRKKKDVCQQANSGQVIAWMPDWTFPSYMAVSISVRSWKNNPTVDGWNPARKPVEVGSWTHYLQGLYIQKVVLWDFFHQQ